jgi:MoaA/NifB/PqqE/SkfB family radical SAM enzyme
VPYPYFLTFVVTWRCNSRCQMCNLWQHKDSPFLSLEQIEHIFSQNDFSFVRSLTLTGGEPVLRPDLPQLLETVLKHTPRLEQLLLATNGLNTERTVKHVTHMLQILDETDNRVTSFDVQISLDGVGEVHDTVRGIPGFFQRVQQTLAQLQALKDRFPLLNLRLSCVLLPYNTPQVEALHEFAGRQNIPIYYSPVILSGEYYNNLQQVDSLTFGENHHAAGQFFEKLSREDQTSLGLYYQDMARMIQGQTRSRRCMMGFYGAVLEHNGDVYPCINCEHSSFGNLLTSSFEKVWFGERANEARVRLRASCCPTCTSACYPLPINALEVAQIRWQKWRRRITSKTG